jgi:hypothetical protein
LIGKRSWSPGPQNYVYDHSRPTLRVSEVGPTSLTLARRQSPVGAGQAAVRGRCYVGAGQLRWQTQRTGRTRCCPMTSNFHFCKLVVLDRRRLPLKFPRPAADGPLADTFMQAGNLPKWSPKRLGRQTSLSRVTALRQAKRANRTLCRAKIDNTDSSWQVSDARRGIFDVTGQLSTGRLIWPRKPQQFVPCRISRPAPTSLTCAGLFDWQTILVGRAA